MEFRQSNLDVQKQVGVQGKEVQEFRGRRFKSSGEGGLRVKGKELHEFWGRSFKSSGERGS